MDSYVILKRFHIYFLSLNIFAKLTSDRTAISVLKILFELNKFLGSIPSTSIFKKSTVNLYFSIKLSKDKQFIIFSF